MMLDIDSAIQRMESIEDLKPLLKLVVSSVNTLNDARSSVKGDLIFKNGGVVLRCTDGNYYRVNLTLSGGVPSIELTLVGKNPTGE
jgi:hypothetical protein